MTEVVFDHSLWLLPVLTIGACIGSFLNVVIYRFPLGMSVNKPSRSFCPICKNQLSIWQNFPILSWLFLRGKCAHCNAPIPFRYILVEIVTALLFLGVWLTFPPVVVVFLWILMGLLVAITWIDAEHMLIPTQFTWAGSAIGLISCAVWPSLSSLNGSSSTLIEGVLGGVIGWVVGFLILWVVIEFGKKAFGRREMKYEQEVEWSLLEPSNDHDPLLFVIDGEPIPWWDIFSRKTDRLLVDATEVMVNGQFFGAGALILCSDSVQLADGQKFELETLQTLSGKARSAVIPREAMGMGDPHLLAMIGAFFGWGAVLFSMFAAAIFAIFAAIIGRIGLGKPLPFGPFLALGACTWMFGAWKLWSWYLHFVGF